MNEMIFCFYVWELCVYVFFTKCWYVMLFIKEILTGGFNRWHKGNHTQICPVKCVGLNIDFILFLWFVKNWKLKFNNCQCVYSIYLCFPCMIYMVNVFRMNTRKVKCHILAVLHSLDPHEGVIKLRVYWLQVFEGQRLVQDALVKW